MLDSCDISSASGSGVGAEGGSPQLYNCSVHDCATHGVALFGGLDGSRASPVLEACQLRRNRQHGLLVRDGATPAVSDSVMARNGGYGMMLQVRCVGTVCWERTVQGRERPLTQGAALMWRAELLVCYRPGSAQASLQNTTLLHKTQAALQLCNTALLLAAPCKAGLRRQLHAQHGRGERHRRGGALSAAGGL